MIRASLAAVLLWTGAMASAEPLTDAGIERWAQAYRSLQQWSEQHPSDDSRAAVGNPDRLGRKLGSPFSASLESAKGLAHYEEYVDIMEDHGFTPQSWANTGDRIFRAFTAMEMGARQPEMNAQMRKALADIDANPNMSAEQKAQMKAMLESSMGGIQSISEAPAEDIAAVRRNHGLIERLFNDE